MHSPRKKTNQKENLIIQDLTPELLSDIAIISGYDLNLTRGLPDGTVPDVLRRDSFCGRIFLGEAKDTESPGSLHTRKRLLNYLGWFRLISSHRKGSLFVLCFGDIENINRWKSTLSELALYSGMKNYKINSDYIDHENFLIILKPTQ